MTTVEKRTFCRVCEPACGLIATVEGDELIALKADKEHPISKGFVCNKGIYGLDVHNDPDRLNHPLKRTADGFEAISWDQALAEIAEKLQRILGDHGAGSMATYTGNPTAFNSLYGPSFGSFVRQAGARKHFSSGTQDCSNKFAGSEAAERLGQRSRNAYARYEQGRAMPSVEKLEQLLRAIAPDQRIVWRIAA